MGFGQAKSLYFIYIFFLFYLALFPLLSYYFFLLIIATAETVITFWTYVFPVDTTPSSVRLSIVPQMFPRQNAFIYLAAEILNHSWKQKVICRRQIPFM